MGRDAGVLEELSSRSSLGMIFANYRGHISVMQLLQRFYVR